jgi:hypothetical protein
MILGATVFWTPDLLWHAATGQEFGNRGGVLWLALIMPLALLGTYVYLKNGETEEKSKVVGLALMAGVYLLGGPFMFFGATFSGMGLLTPGEMLLLPVSPPLLFETTMYDGSLAALLVVFASSTFILAGQYALKRRLG